MLLLCSRRKSQDGSQRFVFQFFGSSYKTEDGIESNLGRVAVYEAVKTHCRVFIVRVGYVFHGKWK
jgi:hypothetical protein